MALWCSHMAQRCPHMGHSVAHALAARPRIGSAHRTRVWVGSVGGMNMNPQPGWYPEGAGLRWWDGNAWTEHRQAGQPPVPTAAQPANGPLFEFTSHIAGKNARVHIFNDRIEWNLARGVSGGKVTAGLMTGGLSMLATGVRNGKAGSEMIPIKNISSVTTKRDGMLNTVVQVVTSGNTIDFRVSHAEAAQIRGILNDLILRGPLQSAPTIQQSVPASQQSAPVIQQSAPDVVGQLTQLGQLRDAGVLTAAEFDAKKAELLARM